MALLGLLSCKSDSWRRCTCTNVLLVCEGEVGELVQPGGMWGLPWGFLCGTSGRKDLCMMPCHCCHIYGIWTSRSKKVWGCLEVINWGCRCKSQKGGFFHIGKAGSHFVILLYYETLLQVLLGTVKDFIGYLFSLYYWCYKCLRLVKPKVQLKVS